ncbi:MAG TPA: T9SS type A sorting domain-containing protein [Bacteroidota bacterium]|jgi:hypothetical protein
MKPMLRFAALLAVAAFIALDLSDPLLAATPGTGTLTSLTRSQTWTGGPFTAADGYTYAGIAYTLIISDPELCTSMTCDKYFLTVNIPASYYVTNPTHSVRVQINWASSNTDFDMYVYDAAGNQINSSGQGNTTFELVDLGQLTTGTYQILVIPFTAVDAGYNGSATVGPPPVENARLGKYKNGNFTFTPAKALGGPDGLLFGTQDLEPRAVYDGLGNIYVAGIEGTPGGTDVWKSGDGGNSFTYLGQPDGGQAASALAGRTPGAGGGDEDIAVGSTGTVYMASLWGAVLGVPGVGGVGAPLAATMCTSTNGGTLWVDNPWAQSLPIVDRQWIATYGDKTVYLTYQQEGVDLQGTNSLWVVKSTDGGLTFPQATQLTTPQLGTQPDFQGNIAVDQQNGNVYTVFIGHPGNSVYIARSSDGGRSFVLKLVRQGEPGISYSYVFPILALDRGGNVHVVYSDGTNVYLTSSADQGATWTLPVRVNNGPGAKLAIAPWVDAGDAGKVDIMWWSTSSTDNLAPDAQWKVYFAQTLNAFAKTPTISENAASGVFHSGPICVNGTACTAGTRNLAEYASTTVYLDGKAMIVYPDDQQTANPMTYFLKQTGGPGVLSSPHAVAAPALAAHREESNQPPQRYSLDQNYPNPFNPVTNIRYSLPERGFVQLTVHNLLGQEVARLVNAEQQEGVYSVPFDASLLSTGVYFYEVRSGAFVDTKRMLLLK